MDIDFRESAFCSLPAPVSLFADATKKPACSAAPHPEKEKRAGQYLGWTGILAGPANDRFDLDAAIDRVEDPLSYYAGLKRARVPVEMHLYAQGGGAFGLRRTKFPATRWPLLVETWLHTIGMLPE